MVLETIVTNKLGDPTLMVLQNKFKKYWKVQDKKYKLLEIITQKDMVELEGYIILTWQIQLHLANWFWDFGRSYLL